MTRQDTGSRTEADAAAFERRFGVDYSTDDGPDPSDFETVLPAHDCQFNGGVSCRACDAEEMREEALLSAEDAEAEREYLDAAEDSAWLESKEAGYVAVWFLFAILAGSLLALAVVA
jgi:hypothetical protein